MHDTHDRPTRRSSIDRHHFSFSLACTCGSSSFLSSRSLGRCRCRRCCVVVVVSFVWAARLGSSRVCWAGLGYAETRRARCWISQSPTRTRRQKRGPMASSSESPRCRCVRSKSSGTGGVRVCLCCVRVFIAYRKQHACPGGARPRESESLVFVPRQAVFSREFYFYLYGLYCVCACVASPQYSSPRFRGHRFPPPLGKHAVVGCALLRFWFSVPLCWGGAPRFCKPGTNKSRCSLS